MIKQKVFFCFQTSFNKILLLELHAENIITFFQPLSGGGLGDGFKLSKKYLFKFQILSNFHSYTVIQENS